MKNFAITSIGRSGTKFLSENMNRSEKWTVNHEPARQLDYTRPVKDIQTRFNRDYYGEVNGYLCFAIDSLDVEKRGIILRDPAELYLAITTWHSGPKWQKLLPKKHQDDFHWVMRVVPYLLTLAESGRYFVIDFNRMVSDQEYLKMIFKHFGVTDVRVTKKMLETKINKVPDGINRKTWADFSPDVKDALMRLSEDYRARTERIFNGGGS